MDGAYQGIMADADPNAQRQITPELRNRLREMEAVDSKLYEEKFSPLAHKARESFANGDLATFGSAVSELSNSMPMPYRYRAAPDGTLNEMFRSTKEGGYVDTGRKVSPHEAMGAINKILQAEQKILSGVDMQTRVVNPAFLQQAAQYRLGTIASNAEAMADDSQWIQIQGEDGQTLYAIPQNSHDDYSANTTYLVLDEASGKSFYVNSLDELRGQEDGSV